MMIDDTAVKTHDDKVAYLISVLDCVEMMELRYLTEEWIHGAGMGLEGKPHGWDWPLKAKPASLELGFDQHSSAAHLRTHSSMPLLIGFVLRPLHLTPFSPQLLFDLPHIEGQSPGSTSAAIVSRLYSWKGIMVESYPDLALCHQIASMPLYLFVVICHRLGLHYASVNVSECFIAFVPPIPKSNNHERSWCKFCHYPRHSTFVLILQVLHTIIVTAVVPARLIFSCKW